MKLISKIQRNNYDIGEFSDIGMRNLEDVYQLIGTFDWKAQREAYSVIGITGAGICIEKENTFLKIGLYYNYKFRVWYYHLGSNSVFSVIVQSIEEALEYVKLFYENDLKITNAFQEQNKFLKNYNAHFITNTFYYKINSKRKKDYFLSVCGFGVIFSLIFFVLFVIFREEEPYFLLAMFFICWLPNWLIYAHFIRKTKGYALQISLGQDVFYFGKSNAMVPFSKKDIVSITEYGTAKYSKFLEEFTVLEILMNNNTKLIIPNALIEDYDLMGKVGKIQYSRKFRLPRIKYNTLIVTPT